MHIELISSWIIWVGVFVIGFGSVVLGLLAWYIFFPNGGARAIPGLSKVRPSLFKLLLAAAGLFVMLNTMLSTFVGITIERQRVTLDYCWPRRDVVVEISDDIVIRSQPVNNGRRAAIVILDKEKTYFGSSNLQKISDEIVKTLKREVGKEAKK